MASLTLFEVFAEVTGNLVDFHSVYPAAQINRPRFRVPSPLQRVASPIIIASATRHFDTFQPVEQIADIVRLKVDSLLCLRQIPGKVWHGLVNDDDLCFHRGSGSLKRYGRNCRVCGCFHASDSMTKRIFHALNVKNNSSSNDERSSSTYGKHAPRAYNGASSTAFLHFYGIVVEKSGIR